MLISNLKTETAGNVPTRKKFPLIGIGDVQQA